MTEIKSDADILQTPLTGRHEELGARMIPFAGWLMPVQYEGILSEHRTVRTAAGLFDLGHMGQFAVSGPQATEFLQHVTSNDISLLEPGDAQYGLITNEQGGVVDDIITYRLPDTGDYMVVVNAANREKDFAWFDSYRSNMFADTVSLEDKSFETGMIAIQGPEAEGIVAKLTDSEVSAFGSFSIDAANLAGVPVLLARTGYTGEDGFEIYSKADDIGTVWDSLMDAGKDAGLKPIGLGARDTLRLEARMPLYGNELSDEISPLEAGLGWAVKLEKGDFVGREVLLEQKESGIPRRTIGFKLVERSGAARSHADVQHDGKSIGYVTSGAFSPTFEENIGLALVDRSSPKVGEVLEIVIRNRPVSAERVKVPFYKRDS